MLTARGAFCCGGCASVFELLHANGLQAFYACETVPGVSQRARHPGADDRFAALDDPAILAGFVVTITPQHARLTLRVPSLHCASCVWLIEQLWRVVPGATRSEVDLTRKIVRADFDPTVTSARKIAETLTSIGYEPSLEDGPVGSVAPATRELYLKIGVAGFAFGNVMLFSIPQYITPAPLEPVFRRLFDVLNLALAVPVLLYSASDYFRGAWAAVRQRTATIDIPIALGLTAIFGRSIADIATGAGTGFFDSFSGLVFALLVGRLFQQKAFDAIAFDRDVRSFLPLFVRAERGPTTTAIPIQDLRPGDVLHVRPHEVVPADALLLDRAGTIDYAFVTGEQAPVSVNPGEIVRAGGRVAGQALRLRALRGASHGALAELWTHPVLQRVKRRWLVDVSQSFSVWFTVMAVGLAVAGVIAWWPDARMALQVATAVLIIACPCALTLAAPITLGTAMGVLGRAGCFLKSPAVALDLARIDTVVFDKTGTLTAASRTPGMQRDGLDDADWGLVRALAGQSTHPVSRAIAAMTGAVGATPALSGAVDQNASGVRGSVEGQLVAIGRASFVADTCRRPLAEIEGVTWVAVGDRVGRVHFTAPARAGIAEMLSALGRRYRLSLISGDHAQDAPAWRQWFRAHMTFRQGPLGKLAAVRREAAEGHHVLMVGDGLNDAGALAAAEVGMAVSDDTACLVPACDVVIRGDRLVHLPAILAYAKRAKRVIVLCFVVSIAYNVIGLSLALAGRLTPFVTAILMPVSSVTVIGLSVGLMRWHRSKELAPCP